MLTVKNIYKRFGDHQANNNLSLSVSVGGMFGLLGPNGAGKTTLLRIITGIYEADQGEVRLNGELISNRQLNNIGYMPEERGLYKKMKVGEHLQYFAGLKSVSKKIAKERIHYWLEKLELKHVIEKKVEALSKGMQQKVQFIGTVIHEPDLVILDEPFSGLDPVNAEKIKAEILELNENGTTIIFSTHRLEQAEALCQKVALIKDGSCLISDKVQALKEQFRPNEFILNYTGSLQANSFPFESETLGHDNLIIKSKANNGKEILAHLMKQDIIIKSFSERLPSLNDIFITLIGEE